jgi:hypothetical protein
MDITVACLIGAMLRVIVEFVTGTFYRLVLGIAGFMVTAIGYVRAGFAE